MAFGRERIGTRAFLTVASLFALATFTTPARAQEASEPEVVALEGVDFTDRTISSFAPLGATFADMPRLDLRELPRVTAVDEETGDDEIVVTAQREENFAPTDEFDENIFDRLGVESTTNPDLAGLVFLTPKERRDNGWAVRVPVLGSRRGETGPFMSVGAGRPESLITVGTRF